MVDKITLHKEIADIMKECGRPMHVREITDEVNKRKIYRKRDNSRVNYKQISRRCRIYTNIFKKVGPATFFLKS